LKWRFDEKRRKRAFLGFLLFFQEFWRVRSQQSKMSRNKRRKRAKSVPPPLRFCRCQEILVLKGYPSLRLGVEKYLFSQNALFVSFSRFLDTFEQSSRPVFGPTYVMSEPFCQGGVPPPFLLKTVENSLSFTFLSFLSETRGKTSRIPDSTRCPKTEKSHFFSGKRTLLSGKRRHLCYV